MAKEIMIDMGTGRLVGHGKMPKHPRRNTEITVRAEMGTDMNAGRNTTHAEIPHPLRSIGIRVRAGMEKIAETAIGVEIIDQTVKRE